MMRPEDSRIDELLRALDHPVPPVTVEAIARRAARRRLTLPWAAAVLLAIGAAGAAFALPGSPLRRWIAGIAERWGREHVEPQQPALPSMERGAGVAVAPGSALLILFDAPTGGMVRVALADRPDVLVRAWASHASFTAGDARLLIDTRGVPDTFTIEIPRAAPRVEIRAGPARIFLKAGERVATGAEPDAAGVYRVPLLLSGPELRR